MIVAFLNQKGGCGKSTLTTNVAVELASRGFRVLVLDADQQQSSIDWGAARRMNERDDLTNVTVLGLPTATIHSEIENLSANYDHVLIDGPARVGTVSRSALMAADFVVIPVTPSPYDIWASNEIIDICKEASVYRPVDARFLINRKISGTKVGREVRAALDETGMPVMDSYVTQRISFASSASEGIAAREIQPRDQSALAAADDIEILTNELLKATNS